jgi:hypothetical protein
VLSSDRQRSDELDPAAGVLWGVALGLTIAFVIALVIF